MTSLSRDADPRLAQAAAAEALLPEVAREVDAIVNRAFATGLLVETPDGRILRGVACTTERHPVTRVRS